eukprot:GEMP01057852.1.p1 GENE.GEMP01057852.1~~GEMP01057852.1.p1  ORF type:complete len:227 (+),score=26.87 GEMP01057852.1:261-941(+)
MYSGAGRNVETCCFCVPLRMGVFLSACLTFLGSILMITSKIKFEDSVRVFGGGYVIESRVIIGLIEATGCMWGIIGLLGAWYNRASYVRIFNYYQMVRLASWIIMCFTDLPVLMQCEMWVMDINRALKTQGWNPVMYKVAFSGHCYNERALFIVCSAAGFLGFVYLTYANVLYQSVLEEEPKYLLRASKDLPIGAFFTQSLGEKAYLLSNQQRRQHVGHPVKLQLP